MTRHIHWSELAGPRWIETVTPDELRTAIQIADGVARNTLETENPANVSRVIHWGDGRQEEIRFADRTENRVTLAIGRAWPGERGFAVNMRLHVLFEAVAKDAVRRTGHVKVDEETTAVSDELIAAVASIQLSNVKKVKTLDLLKALRREEKRARQ